MPVWKFAKIASGSVWQAGMHCSFPAECFQTAFCFQNYYLGLVYEELGNEVSAKECFKKASHGIAEPASAMYYNDQPPETIFYQGMALERLGNA